MGLPSGRGKSRMSVAGSCMGARSSLQDDSVHPFITARGRRGATREPSKYRAPLERQLATSAPAPIMVTRGKAGRVQCFPRVPCVTFAARSIEETPASGERVLDLVT